MYTFYYVIIVLTAHMYNMLCKTAIADFMNAANNNKSINVVQI